MSDLQGKVWRWSVISCRGGLEYAGYQLLLTMAYSGHIPKALSVLLGLLCVGTQMAMGDSNDGSFVTYRPIPLDSSNKDVDKIVGGGYGKGPSPGRSVPVETTAESVSERTASDGVLLMSIPRSIDNWDEETSKISGGWVGWDWPKSLPCAQNQRWSGVMCRGDSVIQM